MPITALLIFFLGSFNFVPAVAKDSKTPLPESKSTRDWACSDMTGEVLAVCDCVIKKGLDSEDLALRQEIIGIKMRLSQAQRHMTKSGQAWVRTATLECRENLLRKQAEAKATPKPTPNMKPVKNLGTMSMVDSQSTPTPTATPTLTPSPTPGQPVPVKVTPFPRTKSRRSDQEQKEKKSEPQNEHDEYQMLNESESPN